MKKISQKIIFLIIILISNNFVFGQEFTNANRFYFKDSLQTQMTINFKFINNLIVIPLQINESDTLHFILDTGLRFTVLTKLPENKSVVFNKVKETLISGLGEDEDSKAWITYNNKVEINNITSDFVNIYVLEHDRFNLSSQMGIEINGLIGNDLFENFIVKIDYTKEKITFCTPSKFKYNNKYKKWAEYPIILYNQKPYIQLPITLNNDSIITAKLLVDNGSSDALWLFPGTNSNIELPNSGNNHYLGQGLNGNIYGKQSRVKNLEIGRFKMKDVTTLFPDSLSVKYNVINDVEGRNGSIGSEILKRFYVIIDYSNQKMLFKANSKINDDFYFNLSGLEVIMPMLGLPIYEISQVRKDSPADIAGVKVGDQLVEINNISIISYTFNDIINIFKSKAGRRIKLKLNRNGEFIVKSFKLIEI